MIRYFFLFMFSTMFLAFGPAHSWAADQDERNAQEASAKLDQEAKEGPQKVEQRLAKQFNVSEAQVDALRQKGLGFGEIGILLGLAKQMPGGVNDQNINTILSRRDGQGHKQGWGEIAKNLNIKLGSAVKTVNRNEAFESEVRTPASHGLENMHNGGSNFRMGGAGHGR